ncbi:unnamed protein product [Larinioides sclopetarius]|uniref:Uncharacterized protein n=1 Tax=Larinioides sclopetarius TaxID=280406 RepID=A0AAV1YVF9_9ARAC
MNIELNQFTTLLQLSKVKNICLMSWLPSSSNLRPRTWLSLRFAYNISGINIQNGCKSKGILTVFPSIKEVSMVIHGTKPKSFIFKSSRFRSHKFIMAREGLAWAKGQRDRISQKGAWYSVAKRKTPSNTGG